MAHSYCLVAQNGGNCTDRKCSKNHDVIHCPTCECHFPTGSLKEHLNGNRHRQNLAKKGVSYPGIPLVPPSRSDPSTLQSTPLASASPRSEGNASNFDADGADPPVTRYREGVSSTKVPYCATTLQGDTCVDNRCQYRHEVSRCKPCGLTIPASLLKLHQSGKLHLANVASNGSTNSSTPQHSRSPRPAPQPELTPPTIRSPPSTDRPSIPAADLPITVSHEDGLDFVAEGTGTAADHSFPSIFHAITIENISSSSDISVQSMKLAPSPSPWYE